MPTITPQRIANERAELERLMGIITGEGDGEGAGEAPVLTVDAMPADARMRRKFREKGDEIRSIVRAQRDLEERRKTLVKEVHELAKEIGVNRVAGEGWSYTKRNGYARRTLSAEALIERGIAAAVIAASMKVTNVAETGVVEVANEAREHARGGR